MDDRADLRRLVWVVLILCILVDFGILEWLTFQPDVFSFDLNSDTVVPPPSPRLSGADYLTLGGFLLFQAGLIVASLRLREGTSQSTFGPLR
jgi:hypothetical protein